MKTYDLLEAVGEVDDVCVKRAREKKKTAKRSWITVGSFAACLALIVICFPTIFHVFNPAQESDDSYRPGVGNKVDSVFELPAKYNGELLVENLELTENAQIEIYCREDGSVKDAEDWFSLIIIDSVFSETETVMIGDDPVKKAEHKLLLHCFFDGRTVEKQKVDMVFTKDATQMIEINGVEVQLARHSISLEFEYWYYAVFEYDGVVYDLRTKSNSKDHIYDVLDRLLKH